MNVKKCLLAALFGLVLAASPELYADGFPQRPLTMLIGFHPHGSTDIQARVLVQVLEEQLGQPVRILHNPGAGGGVAAAMLAGSAEQGYIFQFGVSSTITFAPLVSRTSYDAHSFRYVAGVSLDQSAFVTGPTSPFSDWAGLIDFARRSDGVLFATQTALDRLLINYIARKEGLNIRIVPTSGGGAMAPLVLSGDVDFAYSGGTHSGYTDSGQMRVLAGLADDRLIAYPEVPTLRQLGYDIAMHAVRVVTVPADTPESHVERLAAALEVATRDPRFVKVTEQRLRMPVVYMTGEEVKAMVERQVREYRELINHIGL